MAVDPPELLTADWQSQWRGLEITEIAPDGTLAHSIELHHVSYSQAPAPQLIFEVPDPN